MINVQQAGVLHELYSNIVRTVGDIAYDINNEEVNYDLSAINAKVASNEQTQATAKASALAKLTALGLSEDEVKALVG